MPFETVGTPALWAGFIAFVLAMLALDLGVFHKKAHEISLKEAGVWSVVWIALAAVFNVGVYLWFGPDRGLEFTTGYLLEKALAIDPTQARAHYLLGICYSMDDKAKAREHLNKFIEMAPNDPDAAAAKEMLQDVK